MNFLVLDNVALPITTNATGGQWIDALDYFPNYRIHGGRLSWGGYVSWLLKYAGEEGFTEAFQLLTPMGFLERYKKVKEEAK